MKKTQCHKCGYPIILKTSIIIEGFYYGRQCAIVLLKSEGKFLPTGFSGNYSLMNKVTQEIEFISDEELCKIESDRYKRKRTLYIRVYNYFKYHHRNKKPSKKGLEHYIRVLSSLEEISKVNVYDNGTDMWDLINDSISKLKLNEIEEIYRIIKNKVYENS